MDYLNRENFEKPKKLETPKNCKWKREVMWQSDSKFKLDFQTKYLSIITKKGAQYWWKNTKKNV